MLGPIRSPSSDRGFYLITGLSIQQQPANLNDLSRVFRHVNAMFIAGSRYVDYHIAVDARLLGLITGHIDRPMSIS